MNAPESVDFWFDPSCPFTWRTSRWLIAAAAERGVPVRWHLMSLAILNAGREVPEHVRQKRARGQITVRVFEAVRRAHGGDAMARFYAEFGARVHEGGAEACPDLYREALTAAGLPAELAEDGDDDAHQPGVETSHAEGQQRVGAEAGSPITAFAGRPGFFGPIVTPAPAGEDVVRLFDGLALVTSVPGFSELKGARGSL